jgi:hypothetical protein
MNILINLIGHIEPIENPNKQFNNHPHRRLKKKHTISDIIIHATK